MNQVNIRVFENSEWRDYRNLRLRALQESPDSFGSTFEFTRLVTDAEWLNRLESVLPESDLPLAGLVNNNFAGMAWVKIEHSNESIAHLFQMWVTPEYRSNGVGRKLLNSAIKWVHERETGSLVLSVTCGDSQARKLYDSTGFAPAGKLGPLRPGSNLMVQPMEIQFNDAGI